MAVQPGPEGGDAEAEDEEEDRYPRDLQPHTTNATIIAVAHNTRRPTKPRTAHPAHAGAGGLGLFCPPLLTMLDLLVRVLVFLGVGH